MNDENRNTEQVIPAPNSHYKDRLFTMIFHEKKEMLELYNAVNGTSYTNLDDLQFNTLENAIFMSMHNDVSFIIDLRLNLYEHQSTYSPNLPLRFLFYTADVYSDYTKDANLYGTKPVKLPSPRFIIFYNGQKKLPDRQELKLSDIYEIPEDSPWLELKAVMLNINKGHNPELMKACKTLQDYAEYTDKVRRYARETSLSIAVMNAIDECISKGILADFLKKNKSEAIKMSIYEYDQEKHMKWIREEGREEGIEEGEILGYIKFAIKKHIGVKDVIADIMNEFKLNEKEAKDYYKEALNKINGVQSEE